MKTVHGGLIHKARRHTDQGLAMRSWRYSMVVEDGAIRKLFVDPDFRDNPPGVPLQVSGAETMLDYLRGRESAR